MTTKLYLAFNGAGAALTAAPVKIATGTSIKTLQQLSPPANGGIEIIEWGISFDGSAAATPGVVELVNTAAINATVTAYAAGDITKLGASPDATRLTLGVGNSGFTSSAEGSITATQEHDVQMLPPTAPYIKQFPLERGPEVLASTFERIRVTFGTTINALCYIVWAE